jgi:hypothetical protein
MGIPEFIENFVSIDFEKLIDTAVFDNEAELVDALTAQLQTGRDQMGDRIGEYKSNDYAEMKFNMNPKAGMGFVDLKYTGDFYSGMFLEKIEKDFQIRSSDSKAEDLADRYGEWIYGLQTDNLNKVIREDILPVLQDSVRKEMYV